MTRPLTASPGTIPMGTTARKALHPLAVITILSLVIPINWMLGSLFMTPSRALFLITVPYLFIRWAKGDFNGRLAVDWLMILYVFWITVTIIRLHPDKALTFVGTTTLIILGGYLTARATIRSIEDFQALIRFMAWIVMCMMPLALIESISHDMFIGNFIDSLPGVSSNKDVDYCCRMGLDRAQVVFAHPIHYGLFASLPFALYAFGLRNQVSLVNRLSVCLVLGVACFLSISSGPFLSMLFQAAIVAYAMTTQKIEAQWRFLLITLSVFYVIIEVNTSHFGLFTIATKLSFNSATANVRAILFDYGIDQIWRTPIMGNGYRPFPLPPFMTGSVDNFWLLLAVVHGMPAFAACMGAFLYSMIRAGRGKLIRGSDLYNARVAWTALLTSLLLTLATVAIWSEIHSAVFLMLGAGQFLFYATEPTGTPAESAGAAVRVLPRLSRFTPGERPAAPVRALPLLTRFTPGERPAPPAGRPRPVMTRADLDAGTAR